VPVNLSAHEYSVLEALLQRPGAVLSRAQLEDRLYGWEESIGSNAVEVYIHGLRRKLGADVPSAPCAASAISCRKHESIRARLLLALIHVGGDWSRRLPGPLRIDACSTKPPTLFDYQLRQMALSLRSQISLAPRIEVPPDQGDTDFVVQIWDLFGARMYLSRPGLPIINQVVLGLR
jgi:hypothetical protein